jgi:predicted DNA-binding transcriptional regulator AlpA
MLGGAVALDLCLGGRVSIDRDHPGCDGPERLLTVDEVACWLGKPKATLYVWRTRGLAPRGIKVGNVLRYRRRDVEAWLDRQAEEPETPSLAVGAEATPCPRRPTRAGGRHRRELAGPRSFRAGCRVRDHNRPTRDVETWGATDATERTQLVMLRDRVTPAGEEITGDTRIGTLGERWLHAVIADADVAPQTIDRYESSLRTAILPELNNVRVRELTVGRLERFFRSLRDRPGTARGAKTVLGRMLAMAVRHGALAHNPIRELERKRRPRRGARALTVDDLHEVRAAIHRWQHPLVRRPGPGTPKTWRTSWTCCWLPVPGSAKSLPCAGVTSRSPRRQSP